MFTALYWFGQCSFAARKIVTLFIIVARSLQASSSFCKHCYFLASVVSSLELTWKQSFLILVDSEIFRQRSLYQFEIDSEETKNLHTLHSSRSTQWTFLFFEQPL